ncbi:Beta-1,4-mannooligosaccharide phosphorylase [Limihaloglobus sulfuriphilus]|uniref:Beta-1,4-mannooligosaccharide phosphorylase n=1 Tax=Limihaloglobus sulfuriphilus TaxID=1851148 RepID=A0A1Q2MB03_9BACT|nr:glycosidase [Limihaloglobus sulfuriphilus]AQQ69861.1 Beta-1,4-mannooligosaccharide phosphorylase [Limihaloglobus sulfuriphilus]
MKLIRYEKNPILSPNPANEWESLVTTNPGAWYDQKSGKVLMLYRAAGNDPEHVIRLGLAVSDNGYDFERVGDEPVFGPSKDGFDAGCVEDPRIIKIGEYYYVTYATRYFHPGQYWLEGGPYSPPQSPDDFPLVIRENATSTGLAITKDFKNWIRAGRMTNPLIDDRDVILFPEKINGKYALLHRPMSWVGDEYGTEHPAMWVSFSDDMLVWGQSRLLATGVEDWERKIGGNTPPIKTRHGWLTTYHAVGRDNYYRLGAMLLDINEPWKVTHRTKEWILEPQEDYETQGCYEGGGVVFPCGKVIIGDTLFVYYGAADKYVGLAVCKTDELLDYLLSCPVK